MKNYFKNLRFVIGHIKSKQTYFHIGRDRHYELLGFSFFTGKIRVISFWCGIKTKICIDYDEFPKND